MTARTPTYPELSGESAPEVGRALSQRSTQDLHDLRKNGQKKVVATKTVTFDQIVKLAYPTPPTGTNILYTISNQDGPPANPQGSLKEGMPSEERDDLQCHSNR